MVALTIGNTGFRDKKMTKLQFRPRNKKSSNNKVTELTVYFLQFSLADIVCLFTVLPETVRRRQDEKGLWLRTSTVTRTGTQRHQPQQ